VTKRARKSRFVSRPGEAESWVKSPATGSPAPANNGAFIARLTIDVTPALRGRIKVAAFRRGVTVADMLRDLLLTAFPDDGGGRL
jgi:hypothetical protein